MQPRGVLRHVRRWRYFPCLVGPQPIPSGRLGALTPVAVKSEKAVDWVEKAIEQRDPLILLVLRQRGWRAFPSGARWPALAKMMNLPESVS
jgi:hypothetical protein